MKLCKNSKFLDNHLPIPSSTTTMPSFRCGVALASVLAVLATMAPSVNGLDTTVATLGAEQGIFVELAYVIAGVPSDPEPCLAPNGTCLPVLQMEQTVAEADRVVISWTLDESNPNVTLSSNTGIALRACYSNTSQTDRPWRQDKKVINPVNSNQCKKLITSTPLPFSNGTMVWQLPNSLPAAVFNIRAYTVCTAENATTVQYCAWGQSPGFFQTDMWDTTPGWLIAVTIPLICLGPVLMVVYGAGHYIKKGIKKGK